MEQRKKAEMEAKEAGQSLPEAEDVSEQTARYNAGDSETK